MRCIEVMTAQGLDKESEGLGLGTQFEVAREEPERQEREISISRERDPQAYAGQTISLLSLGSVHSGRKCWGCQRL